MEWLAQLQGQVVGLDSAPLIYFIEENPTYLEMTDAFFEAMVRGEFRVVTSVVTLLEVLVYPLRQGNRILAQQYRDILFNEEGLTTIAVSPAIAEVAAQLGQLTIYKHQILFKWLRLSVEVLPSS
jgi:hypothetical protein